MSYVNFDVCLIAFVMYLLNGVPFLIFVLILMVLFLLILLYFCGARFKKAPEAEGKWSPISKKFWISYFFDQRQKSNTKIS